ncbi:hypothetical protein FWD20_02545 [Candidatus Saccharibacteria bacterium]|nr:hypothetical protein [Candidatus Saccharibacteria bacterium]
MPITVIVVCTIISLVLLVVSYLMRYYKLRHTNFQVHPLTPVNWIIGNLIMIVFMMASDNFAPVIIGVVSLAFQVIFLVMGVRKNRHLEKIQWKTTSVDYAFFTFAAIAAMIYYFIGDLNIAALVMFVGGCFGEVPTLRKDFVAPRTDSVQVYLVMALRCVVMFGTLSHINFVGLTNSLMWAAFSIVEAMWLIYCQKRHQLRRARSLAMETVEVSEG